MRQKLCELVAKVCFWGLRKTGHRVPVIRPVTITPRDMQRVRAQEIVTYHLLNQTRPGIKHLIERRVREAMAAKIVEMCEVREEPTPDGVKYYCDMLACNYPIIPDP